ncbi:hypothetical protein NLU13_7236 [Sarocladium strictum]|uniref:Uncharacterized protein n=1 Tax=Sarocladium strictum TaxID=5046 RepID=A0AA39GCF2_SARSR|nr:hypothetical protein NLU13_7236 [Sarocladium strictum]
MLLHVGAGLHGHEYSSTQPHKQPQLQTTLLPSLKDSHSDMGSTPVDRPVSQLLPGMSYLASFLPSPKSFWGRPSSDYFVKNYLPTRFQEVKEEASDRSSHRTSIDGDAFPLYIDKENEVEPNCDTTTCSSSQCSKTKRPKTRFHFARPVPGSLRRHKRSQPRLLLQLRREHDGRPLPSIEVVPARDVAGFKLSSEDIIIMRSDHDRLDSWYGSERKAEEITREKEILAVMTPRGSAEDGSAEIVLDDGTIWQACRRPMGGYEFCHMNHHGNPTVVRWVKRQPASPAASHQFSFCTMDPLVRKHPFLGSLKQTGLDVFETYTQSYTRLQGTRPASYAGDGSLPSSAPKQTANVPDHQKRLMTVTAIWVSFCEDGWPGSLPYSSWASKPKATAVTRGVSEDLSNVPQSSLPTSPIRESLSRASVAEPRPSCAFQGRRSASTGAAFMERRRAAARVASPPSTGSVQDKGEQMDKHPHRSKMRAWAHRVFHPGSKDSTRRQQ